MRISRRIAPALLVLLALQLSARAGGTRERRPAKPVVRTPAAAAKFARVQRFEKKLPAMRKEVSQRLASPQMDTATAVAAIVRIMDTTFMRVGSARFAARDSKPTHGASSLRKRQVKVQGDVVTFNFLGKTGVGGKRRRWRKTIRDPELADAVRVFMRSPGDRLFATPRGAITETQVRAFLRSYGGLPKDLRTHHANRRFDEIAAQLGPHSEKNLALTVKTVAAELEHEPAVSLRSYLDPLRIQRYRAAIPSAE
ncbi:MAG TPA: hypothetical protein VMZ28_07535 [Kofleriaceae bacterium]|nr:hypothetical protein [Kofleriaceae bacterium]